MLESVGSQLHLHHHGWICALPERQCTLSIPCRSIRVLRQVTGKVQVSKNCENVETATAAPSRDKPSISLPERKVFLFPPTSNDVHPRHSLHSDHTIPQTNIILRYGLEKPSSTPQCPPGPTAHESAFASSSHLRIRFPSTRNHRRPRETKTFLII